MTDGLRKSHLRKAPQVGLSEVGLPEGNQYYHHYYHYYHISSHCTPSVTVEVLSIAAAINDSFVLKDH